MNTSQNQVEELPFDIRARRMCTYNYADKSAGKPEIKKELAQKIRSALIEIMGSVESIKNPDLIMTIVSQKIIDCIDYLGIVITYFIADELGHQYSEIIINKSICTGLTSYDQSAIETIVNIFARKDLKQH